MRQCSSMFSQLLSLFPRSEFEKAVRAHRADRGAKGFDCWTQFVAMLFCQLGRAHSLREICGGLASVEGKLNHLGVGMRRSVRRSPMPMRTGLGSSSKRSLCSCLGAVRGSHPRSRPGLACGFQSFAAPLLPCHIPVVHRAPTHADLPRHFRPRPSGRKHFARSQPPLLLTPSSAGHSLQGSSGHSAFQAYTAPNMSLFWNCQ